MTVEEAREQNVCRICKKSIELPEGGMPKGWQFEFREMTYPIKVTINFGEEYAHTECLENYEDNSFNLLF